MQSGGRLGMPGFRRVIEDTGGRTRNGPGLEGPGPYRFAGIRWGPVPDHAIQKKTAVIRLSSMVVPQ